MGEGTSDFNLTVDLDGATKPGDDLFPVGPAKPGRKPRRNAPGELAGTRNEHDAYDTHPDLALACVQWCRDHVMPFSVPDPGPPLVLDPCSGSGPFSTAARKIWPGARVVAVDIRDVCKVECEAGGAIFACADALTLDPLTIGRADLIVTNPPFKLADDLARHLFLHMKEGANLALLLSVTFVASQDRWKIGDDPDLSTPDCRDTRGLFKLAPLNYLVPIVPRPAFTGTSPKFEAALFVWTKGGAMGKDPFAIIPAEPLRWIPPKKTRKKRGS